jgi:hypothetical protein
MARYGLDRRRYTDAVGQKSAKAGPAIGGKPHGD